MKRGRKMRGGGRNSIIMGFAFGWARSTTSSVFSGRYLLELQDRSANDRFMMYIYIYAVLNWRLAFVYSETSQLKGIDDWGQDLTVESDAPDTSTHPLLSGLMCLLLLCSNPAHATATADWEKQRAWPHEACIDMFEWINLPTWLKFPSCLSGSEKTQTSCCWETWPYMYDLHLGNSVVIWPVLFTLIDEAASYRCSKSAPFQKKHTSSWASTF